MSTLEERTITNRPRVAIYARVSTDEQGERNTIDAQLHACRAHCERQGYEVAREFTDVASGAIAFSERPHGSALLAAVQSGTVDKVVIYCLDRLSRDNETGVPAYNALHRAAKGGVEFVLQSFDDTPEGELQFTLFLAIAQYERRVIARRTKGGRHRRAREGRYMPSVVAYGYAKNDDGLLSVDESEAKVVKEIYRLCVELDLGLHAIANRLNEAGVMPPRHYKAASRQAVLWHSTTVSKFLKAERYTGRGSYGPEEFAYPPIIETAAYLAAQEALRRRHKFNMGGTREEYLLQHACRCRTCGLGCTVGRVGRGGSLIAYTCNGYSRGRRHEDLRYRWYAHHIEPGVKDTVRRLMRHPARLASKLEAWLEGELSQGDLEGAEATKLQAALDALPLEEDRVLRAHRKGYSNEVSTQRQMAEIADARQELLQQLGAVTQRSEDSTQRVTRRDQMVGILRELRERGLRGLEGLHQAGAAFAPVYDLPRTTTEWRQTIKAMGLTVWLEPDGGATLEGSIPVPLVVDSFPRS